MMKISANHTRIARILAICERYFGPLRSLSGPRQATVYQEMNLSAASGLAACTACACAAGAPALLILGAASFGFCAGAVTGLLLWSSTGDFPEDPVLPPAPGQERHPRQMAAA